MCALYLRSANLHSVMYGSHGGFLDLCSDVMDIPVATRAKAVVVFEFLVFEIKMADAKGGRIRFTSKLGPCQHDSEFLNKISHGASFEAQTTPPPHSKLF